MRSLKAELRRHALARRDLVSPAENRAAAKAVATSGLALVNAHAAPGAIVSLYWPIRSEIGTRPLFEALAEAGFRTALPVTRASGQPLEFRLWEPDDDLEHGSFGLSHPTAGAPLATPDVLFVPLAAFDSRGARIGYGAGHYDRTLARLRETGRPVAAGLAFALQEVDAVPVEPHDQRLDFVVTESRVLAIGTG